MRKFKKFVIGIVLMFLSFVFLTTDMDNIFTCNKKENICEHKTNSIISQELAVQHAYVLTSIDGVEYKFYQTKSRKRRGGTSVKDHHEVILLTDSGESKFPINLTSAEKAQNVIKDLSTYLENDENDFIYSDNTSPTFIIIMFILFFISGALFLRSATKKEKLENEVKSEEKADKKENPQSTITRG